jgi:hypothetical protein
MAYASLEFEHRSTYKRLHGFFLDRRQSHESNGSAGNETWPPSVDPAISAPGADNPVFSAACDDSHLYGAGPVVAVQDGNALADP